MYLNKAFLYGNLTRDPELRSLPSGGQVASFSIATNRVFKKTDGTKQEQVDFHNIVVFGKQADIVSQYCKKGSPVLVEGRIQTRTWEKDGAKQYRTEIVSDYVQFGPRAAGGSSAGSQGYSAGNSSASHGGAAEQKSPKEDVIEYPQEDINTDDIPF